MKKPKSGFYVVIDISGHAANGNHIPRSSSPTKIHGLKTAALAESRRLTTQNPGKKFGVFECIGMHAAIIPEPTWLAAPPVLEDDECLL